MTKPHPHRKKIIKSHMGHACTFNPSIHPSNLPSFLLLENVQANQAQIACIISPRSRKELPGYLTISPAKCNVYKLKVQ
jgi:hypothetical protein